MTTDSRHLAFAPESVHSYTLGEIQWRIRDFIPSLEQGLAASRLAADLWYWLYRSSGSPLASFWLAVPCLWFRVRAFRLFILFFIFRFSNLQFVRESQCAEQQ